MTTGLVNDMKKLNKKGAMSILMVILIVIIVTTSKSIINITQSVIMVNEIQGTMDMMGMAALRAGVDENKWLMDEEIIIDENLVNEEHNKLFNQFYTEIKNKVIDIELDSTWLHEPLSLQYKSLGIPEGQRDQYFFESTVRVYMPRSSTLGSSAAFTETFYNYFKGIPGMGSATYFQTTVYPYNEKTNVYEIRSISRLVLR